MDDKKWILSRLRSDAHTSLDHLDRALDVFKLKPGAATGQLLTTTSAEGQRKAAWSTLTAADVASESGVDLLLSEYSEYDHLHDDRYNVAGLYGVRQANPNAAANHPTLNTWQKVPLDVATSFVNTSLDGSQGFTFNNPSDRVVCTVAGIYAIQGGVGFTPTAAGQGIGARIYLNGSAAHLGVITSGGSGAINVTTGTKAYRLNIGDYVELWGYQNIASPTAFIIDGNYTYFNIFKV